MIHLLLDMFTTKVVMKENLCNILIQKILIGQNAKKDFHTKIQTLSTAVNSFLMTPNEARGKLDLEKVEGGDRLLGNGASIPVELTGSQYTDGLVTDPPENT